MNPRHQHALKAVAKASATIALVSTTLTTQAGPVSQSTPAGWLPHFESMIALAVVVTAALIATLLNHPQPKTRATGTVLAALSCFGVVAWFVASLSTGVIAEPKAFQTPMDGAKPALLWIQMMVAFAGGIALLFAAKRQLKTSSELELSHGNEVERYGRTSRILHWTTAILFIFMIPTGIFSSMIPEDAWFRTEYNMVHKTVGFILFALVVARLIWNQHSKRPRLSKALKSSERKLAHTAHIMLYGLMLALPITGYLMTSFHGYSSYFFFIEIEPFLPESKAYIVWGLFHKYLLQYVIYIVLGSHILGSLKHHFVDKHKDALGRMVS